MNVSYPELFVTIIGVVSVAAFYALFRFTRMGVVMRAVVDDPDLVSMQGMSPSRIRRLSWIIGCVLAAASGVLVLPFVGLNAITLTFLVVEAFGAAAIGYFSSIPLTFVGALVIGTVADLSTKYIVNVSWLTGFANSLPFIVLLVALLLIPRRKLVRPPGVELRPRLPYRAPGSVRVVIGVLVVVLLALVPQLVPGTKLGFFTIGLTQAILLLSLGLLVRTSGQVSLCHTTFAAIGAVAFSQLAVGHHLPWLLAALIGALIVVPVGMIVAIPAIRLSGLFLALATFGFAILVEQLLYARGFMFTALESGRAIPRPFFARSDVEFFYVVLAFLVVTALVLGLVQQSRLGRVLRGLSEAPAAVTTMGLNASVTRVIVFSISAFFAGMAGILYAGSIHFAVSSDVHFQAFSSLILLAILAVSPGAEPWYAIIAGVAAVVPAYFTSNETANWLSVLFGLLAIRVAMQRRSPAVPEAIRRFLDRFGHRVGERRKQGVSLPVAWSVVPPQRGGVTSGLEVCDIRVRFGGLIAVDHLSLSAPLGRITGLIGPNGAGKTTTFDAGSGLNRRISGRVLLHGVDVTKVGPSGRGRRGLGRTFQRVQLADSLTVEQNVALGREAGMAGDRIFRQLAASRRARRQIRSAAGAALEICGIADLADIQAGALSTGQRRLVELARCLAGPFDVLLLDEPSSGLDRDETAVFGAVLRRVVSERGCGILLVEHDMALVMSVSAYLYVLDFGKLIFEGPPDAVSRSPVVQAAYLGDDLIGAT